MEEKNILTLSPGDYFVHSSGLKIQNTTTDMMIEIEMPPKIEVWPLVVEGKLAPKP